MIHADLPVNSAGSDCFTLCGFEQENAFFFDGVKAGTLDGYALSGAMNTMLVKEAYANKEIRSVNL
jgi:hypothetical protein